MEHFIAILKSQLKYAKYPLNFWSQALYSVRSTSNNTTYSFIGDTQPSLCASESVILSHTGAYCFINTSFPSNLCKVAVRHRIILYWTTSNTFLKVSDAVKCTSSIISKSQVHSLLITVLIISTLQLSIKSHSISWSIHCSFKNSVGTTIRTEAFELDFSKDVINIKDNLVFPKPVQASIVALPPLLIHFVILCFWRSVLEIIRMYNKNN